MEMCFLLTTLNDLYSQNSLDANVHGNEHMRVGNDTEGRWIIDTRGRMYLSAAVMNPSFNCERWEVFWPRHLVADHGKVLLNYSLPQGQMFIMPQLITATLL